MSMRRLINLVEGVQLNELTGYRGTDEFKAFQDIIGKRSSDRDRSTRIDMLGQFVSFLKNKGFHTLGQGAFGAVFEHPKLDYVIKIFRNDPAYFDFLKFALARTDNPYLPRFRGRFMKLDADNYVVRMEKLESLRGTRIGGIVKNVAYKVGHFGLQQWLQKCENTLSLPKEFDEKEFDRISKEVENLQWHYWKIEDKYHEASRDGPDYDRLELAYKEARDKLQKARSVYNEMCKAKNEAVDYDYNKKFVDFSVENKLFCHTIDQIKSIGKYHADFHEGNFMLRGDVPVITDPLFDVNFID